MAKSNPAPAQAPMQHVATTKPGGDEQRPARLKDYKGGSGLVIASDSITIPRMKLLQGTSPELEAFNQAKAGMFWMNVLDIPFGDTLDFIVCAYRERILLMPPLPAKGILARAEDCIHWNPPNGEWQVKLKNVPKAVTWKTAPTVRESGLMEFGSSNPADPNSNPAATRFYEYLIYLTSYPDKSPLLLSLARSQGKRAKDLNGKIEFRKAPCWDQKFRATIINEGDESEKYFNFVFSSNGWADDAQSEECKSIHDRFGDFANIKIADEEGMAGDTDKAAVDDKKREF